MKYDRDIVQEMIIELDLNDIIKLIERGTLKTPDDSFLGVNVKAKISLDMESCYKLNFIRTYLEKKENEVKYT